MRCDDTNAVRSSLSIQSSLWVGSSDTTATTTTAIAYLNPPLARHPITSCTPPAADYDTPLSLLRPTPSVAVGDYVESTLDQSRTVQQQKPIACHAKSDQSRALVDPAILPGLSGRKEGWRVCFAIVPSRSSKPAICEAQARKEQEVSVVG